MSELKVYSQCYDGTDGLFYLKSEADKVIAEKDKEIEEQKRLRDMALASVPNALKVMKIIQHHKYKRCLAMADMCREALCFWDNVKYTYFKGEAYCFRKLNHYGKWGQIWLAISYKFKEAK